MWTLTIEDEQGVMTRVDLARDAYSMGRDGACDIRLAARNVSRRHATLRARPESGWELVDHCSRNGCFLNGRRLRERALLSPSDAVRLGDYHLRVGDGAAASEGAAGGGARATPDRLLVLEGPEVGRELRLDRGPLTVGGGAGCQLVLSDQALRFVVRPVGGGRYEIMNVGPRAELSVNFGPVWRKLLDDGDHIEVPGEVALRFLRGGRAAAADAEAGPGGRLAPPPAARGPDGGAAEGERRSGPSPSRAPGSLDQPGPPPSRAPGSLDQPGPPGSRRATHPPLPPSSSPPPLPSSRPPGSPRPAFSSQPPVSSRLPLASSPPSSSRSPLPASRPPSSRPPSSWPPSSWPPGAEHRTPGGAAWPLGGGPPSASATRAARASAPPSVKLPILLSTLDGQVKGLHGGALDSTTMPGSLSKLSTTHGALVDDTFQYPSAAPSPAPAEVQAAAPAPRPRRRWPARVALSATMMLAAFVASPSLVRRLRPPPGARPTPPADAARARPLVAPLSLSLEASAAARPALSASPASSAPARAMRAPSD